MSDLAELKAEIRRRSDRFEAFFRAGKAAELVDDYYVEDDPMMAAPDMPLMRSRAEIKTMFEGLVQQFSECRLINADIRQAGDRAYEVGGAVITAKDEQQTVTDCRYLIVWRKVKDGWRVEIDFFAFGKLV